VTEKRGALYKRRTLERIRLLCGCGAGMEAIAPALCEALHDLIDSEANAVFWVDENGVPSGYHHDSAPAELKDFYVRNFEALFADPTQFSMIAMLDTVEPSVGRAVGEAAMKWVLESNVHKYLCAPLGHHHALDMRIDHDGRGRAVFCLWRGESQPYGPDDVAILREVQPLIQSAVAQVPDMVRWRGLSSRTAHFITDAAGRELRSIDAEADRTLAASHLLSQNVAAQPPLRDAPGFAEQLAAMLATQEQAEMSVAVAGGRLLARATWSRIISAGEATPQMLVTIDRQVCTPVLVANYVAALPLTFLQKRIALFAILGGERSACEAEIGVGSEALKKHLRTIFECSGASQWSELALIEGELLECERVALKAA
jgi:hypothetical protein